MADAFLVRRGGGENVKAEVAEQTQLIEDMTASLNTMTESLVGKATGANATPETILKGYSAYVGQELIEGTMNEGVDLTGAGGFTKFAVDKIVFSSRQQMPKISHSLGVKPKISLLLTKITSDLSTKDLVAGYCQSYQDVSWVHATVYNSSSGSTMTYQGGGQSGYVNEKEIIFYESNHYVAANVEYTLITMA